MVAIFFSKHYIPANYTFSMVSLDEISPHLAAVHFRIIMAGQAAETSIAMYLSNHPMSGAGFLQTVIDDLKHCITYLTAAGDHPGLLMYISNLIEFYTGIVSQSVPGGPILRFSDPTASPRIGNEIYMHQGKLLGADPFLIEW